MGWSCSAVANETLEKLTAKCLEQTKSQNGFIYKGKKYFWELSKKEYPAGHITGTVWTWEGQMVSHFCIDGRTGELRKGFCFAIEPVELKSLLFWVKTVSYRSELKARKQRNRQNPKRSLWKKGGWKTNEVI